MLLVTDFSTNMTDIAERCKRGCGRIFLPNLEECHVRGSHPAPLSGAWDSALLAPVAEINEQMLECLRLLAAADAGAARPAHAGAPRLVALLREDWRRLDAKALRRLAALSRTCCSMPASRSRSAGSGWRPRRVMEAAGARRLFREPRRRGAGAPYAGVRPGIWRARNRVGGAGDPRHERAERPSASRPARSRTWRPWPSWPRPGSCRAGSASPRLAAADAARPAAASRCCCARRSCAGCSCWRARRGTCPIC